jgi:hypothetical protein
MLVEEDSSVARGEAGVLKRAIPRPDHGRLDSQQDTATKRRVDVKPELPGDAVAGDLVRGRGGKPVVGVLAEGDPAGVRIDVRDRLGRCNGPCTAYPYRGRVWFKTRCATVLDDGPVPAILNVCHGSRRLLGVEPCDQVDPRVAQATASMRMVSPSMRPVMRR